MATEHENTSAEDQALADEWAAALEETGDVGQDDIDALLAADAATSPAGKRLPMEEFGSVPKNNDPVTLDGPNLDVILDIPVSISMEVGSTEINIRNLLQLNQGSVIELDPPAPGVPAPRSSLDRSNGDSDRRGRLPAD